VQWPIPKEFSETKDAFENKKGAHPEIGRRILQDILIGQTVTSAVPDLPFVFKLINALSTPVAQEFERDIFLIFQRRCKEKQKILTFCLTPHASEFQATLMQFSIYFQASDLDPAVWFQKYLRRHWPVSNARKELVFFKLFTNLIPVLPVTNFQEVSSIVLPMAFNSTGPLRIKRLDLFERIFLEFCICKLKQKLFKFCISDFAASQF
jgi:hypothetical protein